MISPGFPLEMPHFTRGLGAIGANVLGLGDQPTEALGEGVRKVLSAYLQVRNLWDEERVVQDVRAWLGSRSVDRVECLWEPGMVLAGRLREALGAPGLGVEASRRFRDKELMKQALDAAGVRVPRHARARTKSEVRAAAERIGYPLIVKPIAGAGSADTHEVREAGRLEAVLGSLGHVQEVSVEEFIEGEEFTFDTVCSKGRPLFENVAWYRPKPLVARLNEWMSPQSVCLRDIDVPEIRAGRELGRRVLSALEFESGFTHMEWFRTPSGEAVFGEIGGRPPGGRLVHAMNYSCDIDLFVGWAEAICRGTLSQDARKKFNAAVVFKRSQGRGRVVTRIGGLESLLGKYGEHIPAFDLVKIGEPRRDFRQVVSGDGWIVVRHPDLATTLEMADRVGTDLRIFAD
jgi:hypothetical protein